MIHNDKILEGFVAVKERLEALEEGSGSHTHTASQITDLVEAVQDIIGSTVVEGSNVTVDYDDTAGTLTVSSTGGGLTDEQVRDLVAGFVSAGGNISVDHDDAANTLTFSVTGLAISSISGLQSALNNKLDIGSFPTLDELTDVVVAGATDGQALVYDSGTDTWGPGTVETAPPDLTDYYTKGQVDSIVDDMVTSTDVTSIVKLTQAAYDALGTKDANTLYIIVG